MGLISPRNDHELHTWIMDELGLNVPTVSPTEGTHAPFFVLSELYFDQVDRGLLLGARGSGKTWLLAVLNLLVSLFRPGTKTRTAGAVLGHSGVGHRKLQQFCRLPTIREGVVENYEDRILFRNGSSVWVTSGGADSSVISEHAHRVVIDEADLWEASRYDNFILNLTGDGEHPVQIVAASADYSASGLLGRIQQSGQFERYDFDTYTSLAPCQECAGTACKFYVQENEKGLLEPLCQGRGLLARGYNPLAAAVLVQEEISPEIWQRQQMLQATGEGNLWPIFDEERHVAEPPHILATAPRVAGVDWSYPVIVVLAKGPQGRWWVESEWGGKYATFGLLTDQATELTKRYPDIAFFCGAHDQVNKLMFPEWAERGINLLPMQGKMTFRSIRHEEVAKMLEEDRLMFSPECPQTIHQVKVATRRDEERGKRKEDDFRDGLGYGCAGIWETGDLGGLPGGGLVQ